VDTSRQSPPCTRTPCLSNRNSTRFPFLSTLHLPPFPRRDGESNPWYHSCKKSPTSTLTCTVNHNFALTILGRGSTFPLRFAAWRNERKVSPASSEMRMRRNTPFREGLPISRVQFLPWSSFKPSHRMRSAIASTFQMWWGDKMKFTLSDVSKSIDREPTTQNSSPPSPTHATNPRVRFSGNKSA
jgi:hypothetical protein